MPDLGILLDLLVVVASVDDAKGKEWAKKIPVGKIGARPHELGGM